MRLRRDGERPATWVLMLDLATGYEDLTLDALIAHDTALLESTRIPSDEQIGGRLVFGHLAIGECQITPVPVANVELLPQAFAVMREWYERRDAAMAWKRRINTALVSLGGPGATDRELAESSDVEFQRYETLLTQVPGLDLDSFDGSTPAGGPKPKRAPAAWSEEWMAWVNPMSRALKALYSIDLPNRVSVAEWRRWEVLLPAAGVDLTPYQMTPAQLDGATAHVKAVTVIADGRTASQTFDPPTDTTTGQKAARGLFARLRGRG